VDIKFTKMHGCGNDYIYINCFETEIESPEALAILLSDRHVGIGGDGIVLILPSEIADAKMRMFNMDGSEGNMCGNAIRCVGKFLYDNGIVKKNQIQIETKSGIKYLTLLVENNEVYAAKVDMGDAILRAEEIPVKLSGETIIAKKVNIGDTDYEITCVSMGNPHAVVFCENLNELKLNKIGPLFENNEIFPDKVNTEFVEIIERNHLKMRVWERGSGETQACGTGACATAVASVLSGYCDKNTDIKIQLIGGELIIKYTDETVFMTGNCKKVFDGIVKI